MKRVVLFSLAIILVAGMFIVPMAVTNAGQTSNGTIQELAQDGPTATPNDPNWLGFVAARDTLSEELNQRITLVSRYRWAQVAFDNGMGEGCKDYTPIENEDGSVTYVEPPAVYFGWRVLIETLQLRKYEVRVSFDLQTVLVCDEVTVDLFAGESGSGSSGGSSSGELGQVADGPIEFGAQVPNTLGSEAVTYLNQAQLTWVKIQAKDGEDWCGFISNAQSQGFKVLVSALANVDTVTDPSYQTSYSNWLASQAACGAAAVEVHNEPNITREWPAGLIDGAEYAKLLKTAYPIIKAAAPSTIVISGAPAPTGAFGADGCLPDKSGCNDDEWYRQLAAAEGAQYMDCLGVHYNEGIVSPLVNSGDPRDNYPTRYFQSNLSRALAPFPSGMPACITEIGYLSPEGYPALPGTFAWAADTSVEEHAQWLGEAAVLSSQLGNVRLFIVFNLNFTLYGADPQGGYAMVRPDGSCPACQTLASVQ